LVINKEELVFSSTYFRRCFPLFFQASLLTPFVARTYQAMDICLSQQQNEEVSRKSIKQDCCQDKGQQRGEGQEGLGADCQM
jgi:hypothetical protein